MCDAKQFLQDEDTNPSPTNQVDAPATDDNVKDLPVKAEPERPAEEPVQPVAKADEDARTDTDPVEQPSAEQEPQQEAEIPAEFAAIFNRFNELAERQVRRTLEVDGADIALAGDATDMEVIQEQLKAKMESQLAQRKLEQPRKKEQGVERISKKRLKQLLRPEVSMLKLNCLRPDVVEVWDTTAPDPRLLVYLKAYRNTVKVPMHWNQKRKYLSGKRAVEKLPFKLPDYIEQTKIGEIRAAILEKESQRTLKQKQRDKMRPKSNRMHVDFQTLHDAFFKYATKPELSLFGDLYYEGKEREEKTRLFKPGQLTSKLREALAIVLPSQPPPWIIPMQRYGPPPSYPNLKVPGVNAPLPSGAQWGVHPGGWGKPPSDHFGNPLYPSVFADPEAGDEDNTAAPVFWGELVEAIDSDDGDSDEEMGDEEEASEQAAKDATGTQSVLPSVDQTGTTSVFSGASTPMVDDVWAMLGGKGTAQATG